jgi:hypothetical protein
MWRKRFVFASEAALVEIAFQRGVEAREGGKTSLPFQTDPQYSGIPLIGEGPRSSHIQAERVGGGRRDASRSFEGRKAIRGDPTEKTHRDMQQIGSNPFGGFGRRTELRLQAAEARTQVLGQLNCDEYADLWESVFL